jgi:hypothetical protein
MRLSSPTPTVPTGISTAWLATACSAAPATARLSSMLPPGFVPPLGPRRSNAHGDRCCASACASAHYGAMTRWRWPAGNAAVTLPSMPRCVSRHLIVSDVSACCCTIATNRRAHCNGYANSIPTIGPARVPKQTRPHLPAEPNAAAATRLPHHTRPATTRSPPTALRHAAANGRY